MKPYIDFNAQKRKEASNEAEKNHFKRLDNAVYGKTMENMRKRIKIKTVKTLLNIHQELHALNGKYLKRIF